MSPPQAQCYCNVEDCVLGFLGCDIGCHQLDICLCSLYQSTNSSSNTGPATNIHLWTQSEHLPLQYNPLIQSPKCYTQISTNTGRIYALSKIWCNSGALIMLL